MGRGREWRKKGFRKGAGYYTDDAFVSLGAENSDEESMNSGSKKRISCNHSDDGDDYYVEDSCLSFEIPVP
jgi:hypothetical protein